MQVTYAVMNEIVNSAVFAEENQAPEGRVNYDFVEADLYIELKERGYDINSIDEHEVDMLFTNLSNFYGIRWAV